MSRHVRLAGVVTTAAVVVVTALVVPAASVSAATVTTDFCTGDHASTPCVVSATVNGTAVHKGDPNWGVTVTQTAGDSTDLLWNVVSQNTADPYELGSAAANDTWVVVIDAGTVVPRVSFQYADHVTISRSHPAADDYQISITGSPTKVTDNSNCSLSSCPDFKSPGDRQAYLGGDVTDYGSWTDVAQRDAMYGMNFSTNIAATTVPPSIVSDPATGEDQLFIELANQHLWHDSTLFHGFVHLRIPNAFLRTAYGVDDPTTMTAVGLTAALDSAGGGSASVSQESGDDAMLVDVTGITFTKRKLHVRRGVITPTRPTNVHARRTAQHRGKVSFTKARARGSKITGYRVHCVASSGRHPGLTATGLASPIAVTDLVRGVGYDCRVRAKSKAGLGAVSAKVHIPRTVG